MKFSLVGAAALALAAFATTVAQATVVNIDFEGIRPGDVGTSGLYVGPSAAGAGTVFNPLAADSTGGDDNLVVAGTNLLDENGVVTTVGFTISPVGGDNEPGQPNAPASLYSDYIFNNSAGNNTPAGSPFTISGLGTATTADVYLYYGFGQIGGYSITGAAPPVVGTYNSLPAVFFDDVPVVGGSITGLFGVGATGVVGGITVATVPEPTSLALCGLGALGLLASVVRRRKV